LRIPLTRYGLPHVIILPALFIGAILFFLLFARSFLPGWCNYLIVGLLTVVLIWILSFFRDPYRQISQNTKIILAPADGRITDIEQVENADFIGQKAVRIGIFMSIFDPHINRSPSNARVERIKYRRGRHKNAMNPESGRLNESNELALVSTDEPQDRLIVRQISGAVARRIVCRTREGESLTRGQKFGMIKFGSRTELLLRLRQQTSLEVKVGDKVKAGQTVILRYE